MCKKLIALFLFLAVGLGSAFPQPAPKGETGTDGNSTKNGGPSMVTGQRKYTLFLNEGDEEQIKEFNRGLSRLRHNSSDRGLLDNVLGLYKSSAAGQLVSITSELVDMGVQALVNATRSKKPDWEKEVRKESSFVRRLPMQMEILDFYKYPSSNGPLDPENMNLNGFGCRQVVVYNDGAQEKEEEVFYVSCRVDTTESGKARMLNHSKFMVSIDELRFNPALCDLPNDSLGMDATYRIPFDWEKRKDLKFRVNAAITSSWINQAMMIYNDEPLGSFDIVASINPEQLDEDGVFRYKAGEPADSLKNVRVTGECFLVPRSYVGGSTGETTDNWGTGQYKVEMAVYETCNINDSFYDRKENSGEWKEEWKKIKKRRKSKPVWRQIADKVTSRYDNSQWVTILTDPITTTFIQLETDGITRLLNSGPSAGAAKAPSATQKVGK